jgi:hypothetical protein
VTAIEFRCALEKESGPMIDHLLQGGEVPQGRFHAARER